MVGNVICHAGRKCEVDLKCHVRIILVSCKRKYHFWSSEEATKFLLNVVLYSEVTGDVTPISACLAHLIPKRLAGNRAVTTLLSLSCACSQVVQQATKHLQSLFRFPIYCSS